MENALNFINYLFSAKQTTQGFGVGLPHSEQWKSILNALIILKIPIINKILKTNKRKTSYCETALGLKSLPDKKLRIILAWL